MPTALIVEDEPIANRMLSRLVQLRGYQTESAFTGVEALKLVDARAPDLVLLDLMLPDVSGYDICRTMKSRRATADIPIVMVTARLAAENRVQGFRAGAVDYVPKPYLPDQIFAAMTLAADWKSRIDSLSGAGRIVLDAHDEVAYLRHAGDLRSLILCRTGLDEESVDRLGSTVLDLLQRGIDWAKRHRCDILGSLFFSLESDRIVLTLRDQSGWFREDDPRQDGFAALLAQGDFDSVDFRDGCDLRLLRDLPTT